jgi:RHS repeat-associated protein
MPDPSLPGCSLGEIPPSGFQPFHMGDDLKQTKALKLTLSILLTLLVFLMDGFVQASVDSSFRSQRPSADLLTVPEGGRTYDGRGRLKTFTTADGDLIQYLYVANNNLTRLTYPDGKQVNYTYNSRNLPATVTDWSNRVTSYNYDRLGRLTGTTRPNGTSNQIAHDAASQLTSIKESSGTKLISYLAFKYDAAGQVQSRFRAPLVNSGWQHPVLTATYDDDNRLLTANGTNVTHDADGNMTSGPISREGGTGVSPVSSTLTYNSRNQLTYAAGVTYTYDAEGRRRTLTDATGTTRDTIDPSGKLLVRTHPNNTKTYYAYGLGLLYEASQANTTKTYHFDQVGSTLLRSDDSGKVIGQAEYSAYGLTFWKQGDMATPFLYNGQAGVQTDPNGLLNMRARYYSPYLCRFLNADPSGFSGGPNWFAYADGNPISRFDPFGLCGVPSNYVSPYDSDGSVNWTGVGNYLYEAIAGVPDYIQQNGVASAKRNLSDPMFVATNALGGMGMGGITGGLRGGATRVATGVEVVANTTPLYRAVMNSELDDIVSSGAFRNPAGIEQKYFSATAEGAASYARQAFGKMGDTSPYTIIRTDAPSSLLPAIQSVDRGVPAILVPTNVLPKLSPPQVLPYSPYPH